MSSWTKFRGNQQGNSRSSLIGSEAATLIWQFSSQKDVPFMNGIVVNSQGDIVTPDLFGVLYCLTTDGTIRWNVTMPQATLSTPLLDSSDNIYIAGGDGAVFSYDSNGNSRWLWNSDTSIFTSPVLNTDGSRLLINGFDKLIYCIDTANGALTASITLDSPFYASAVVSSQDVLYTISFEGVIYAYDINSNKITWSYPVSASSFTTPLLSNDQRYVYFCADDFYLYKFYTNGTLTWKYQYDGLVRESVGIDADDNIIMATQNGKVIKLFPNGTLVWDLWVDVSSCFEDTLAIDATGSVFLASFCSSNLYSLSSDGDVQWKFSASREFQSNPAIDARGSVLIGSDNGLLYALNSFVPTRQPTAPPSSWPSLAPSHAPPTSTMTTSVPSVASTTASTSVASTSVVSSIPTRLPTQTPSKSYVPTASSTFFPTSTERVWGSFKGNNHGTSWSSQITGSAGADVLWKYASVAAAPFSAGIIVNAFGHILTCDVDGNLVSLTADGMLNWHISLGSSDLHATATTPLLDAAQNIYISTLAGALRSFTAAGVERWSTEVGNTLNSSPVLSSDGSQLFIGCYASSVCALQTSDGQLVRRTVLDSEIYATPVLSSTNTLYISSARGIFYAIDADAGTQRWNYTAGDSSFSSAVLSPDEQHVLFGANDGYLYRFDNTGALQWRYYDGDAIQDAIAIDGDSNILLGTRGGNLVKLSPAGSRIWQQEFDASACFVNSMVVDRNNSIYLGSFCSPYFYSVFSNGTVRWAFQVDNQEFQSDPAIDSTGSILVGSNDGNLYALNSFAAQSPTLQPTQSVGATTASKQHSTLYSNGAIAAAVIIPIVVVLAALIAFRYWCYRSKANDAMNPTSFRGVYSPTREIGSIDTQEEQIRSSSSAAEGESLVASSRLLSMTTDAFENITAVTVSSGQRLRRIFSGATGRQAVPDNEQEDDGVVTNALTTSRTQQNSQAVELSSIYRDEEEIF